MRHLAADRKPSCQSLPTRGLQIQPRRPAWMAGSGCSPTRAWRWAIRPDGPSAHPRSRPIASSVKPAAVGEQAPGLGVRDDRRRVRHTADPGWAPTRRAAARPSARTSRRHWRRPDEPRVPRHGGGDGPRRPGRRHRRDLAVEDEQADRQAGHDARVLPEPDALLDRGQRDRVGEQAEVIDAADSHAAGERRSRRPCSPAAARPGGGSAGGRCRCSGATISSRAVATSSSTSNSLDPALDDVDRAGRSRG